MKKLTLTFFSVIAIISIALFLFLINFRSFLSPSVIKGLFDRSHTYSSITGIIRNDFVKSNNIEIGAGQTFEIINQVINIDVAQILVEDGVDQFFNIIKTKSLKKQILLDYTPIVDQFSVLSDLKFSTENTQYAFAIDLSEWKFFKLLQNYDFLIAIFFILAATSLTAIFLLCANFSERLTFFIPIALLTFIVFAAGNIKLLFFSMKMPFLAASLGIIDQKYLNIFTKIANLALQDLRIPFIIESIALLIIGIVLWFFKKSYGIDRIEIIKKAVKRP